MEYREFGKTGIKISSIGMGTYYDPAFIISRKLHLKGVNRANVEALKSGLDHGITLIDTAELYGTEEVVKEAIKDRNRDSVFIATKAFSNHLSSYKIRKACIRSLKNLGTDYIDLYQIHFPSHFIPVKETLMEMEKLLDEGKIRYIGISNFNLARTMDAVSQMKKYEIASTQMCYNLYDRQLENNGILEYCKKNKMALLAYYPLAHGKLVKGVDKESTISRIVENHKGSKPVHVALNWLLSKGDNIFPIPRASNPEHVIENSKYDSFKLNDDELIELDNIMNDTHK